MTDPQGEDAVRRPIWGVLLAAALGCVILAGLGTWQLKRLAWKESLIERIAARAKAPPVDLEAALRQWKETGDIEYLHVTAHGRFEGRDNFYFTVGDAGPGYHVYTPLRADGGRAVLVNRGYVPDKALPSGDRDYARPTGEVTVTGLVRVTEIAGLFTPGPPAAHRHAPWLSRDLAGMVERTGLSGSTSGTSLVPFFLDADRSAVASGGEPEGGTTRLELPNRHLEYALTWYGLAVTLAVMSALFIRSRRRRD